MKLTVLNVIRRHGIGKQTNREYDFVNLQYLEPVETISTDKFNQDGIGYETCDIPATPEVITQLSGQKLPGIYEFTTDTRKTRQGVEVVLTGIVK